MYRYLNREEQDNRFRLIKELDLSPAIHLGLNGGNPAKSLYLKTSIPRRSPEIKDMQKWRNRSLFSIRYFQFLLPRWISVSTCFFLYFRFNDHVLQVVPNSVKGWGGEIGNFAAGWLFIRWWEPEEEWFWKCEPFLKPKTILCKYWASIKIKISMTCMY